MLYWVMKALLTPMLRGLYRIRVSGRENVPSDGPVILAANHRSFLDSLFLPLVVGRRVTFVAKAEYFDSKKTAWFFRGVGQIPIRREGGNASEGALAAATDVLERGGVFAIYPEGTRTRDGFTHRGHTGVARLALRTGAPVVPVGLVGTEECQPVNRKLPRLFRKVQIRFGAPIPAARYAEDAEGLALRQLTDELMFEIVQLCGSYEYRDTYATQRAEDLPTELARVAPLARTPTTRVA
jgi:1-acyl-sn-glycerol-3-phosphate acyltransferase